jgi:ribosomal protein S18 acetylase RimI-like enzyme
VSATIRPVTIEDLPAVYRLGTRCYHVHDKPYNYWSVSEVADHIENSPEICFVADDDGEIVGFALAAPSYEILEDTGHLEWLAVDPEHRGDGLATRLVETVVEAIRKLGRRDIVADVSSANEASRRLFARAGFDEGISVTFFTRRLR